MAHNVALRELEEFSCDGLVYRAFDHLLAVRSGVIFAVPVLLVHGDMRRVVDRCPVPYGDVLATIGELDRPAIAGQLFRFKAQAGYEAAKCIANCENFYAGDCDRGRVRVMRCPCGVSFAATMDQVIVENQDEVTA